MNIQNIIRRTLISNTKTRKQQKKKDRDGGWYIKAGLERKQNSKIVYERSSPILIKHRKAVLSKTLMVRTFVSNRAIKKTN